MLAFNHSILVLDKTIGNVQIGLKFLEFGHANYIFADFNDFELQFLILNSLMA